MKVDDARCQGGAWCFSSGQRLAADRGGNGIRLAAVYKDRQDLARMPTLPSQASGAPKPGSPRSFCEGRIRPASPRQREVSAEWISSSLVHRCGLFARSVPGPSFDDRAGLNVTESVPITTAPNSHHCPADARVTRESSTNRSLATDSSRTHLPVRRSGSPAGPKRSAGGSGSAATRTRPLKWDSRNRKSRGVRP